MKLSMSVSEHVDKDAPLLVMIHGLGSARTVWKPLIPYLQRTFNIITLDLPGHGLTPLNKDQPMDPQSLAKLIVKNLEQELGVKEFHLVGNSWGGWIVLEIAALFPERVKSVNALAPAGFWLATFDQKFPGEALSLALMPIIKVLAPTLLRYEWGRKFLFQEGSPQWPNFTYETCLDAINAMASSPGFNPASKGMLEKRFESEIDLSVPVNIFFGDCDNTLPAPICQDKAMVPAHAEWITLVESGHTPMLDNPEAVASHMLATAHKNS
jgi:pimeloyl-ACP methyl ester carboxylesterase